MVLPSPRSFTPTYRLLEAGPPPEIFLQVGCWSSHSRPLPNPRRRTIGGSPCSSVEYRIIGAV